jgi:hypothetical protein
MVGISDDLWLLGDLSDKVDKVYGENLIEQFAADISFPGSANTLRRYRDVCRAFPESLGRPAFLSAAKALISHPDRYEIVKQNPNLSYREARQLMHTYSQQVSSKDSSLENQSAPRPAISADLGVKGEQTSPPEPEPAEQSATEDSTSEPSPTESVSTGVSDVPVETSNSQLNISSILFFLFLDFSIEKLERRVKGLESEVAVGVSLRADNNRYKEHVESLQNENKELEEQISEKDKIINNQGSNLFKIEQELAEARQAVDRQKDTISKLEKELSERTF